MIQLMRFFKLVETETANLLDILGESIMTSRKVFIPLNSESNTKKGPQIFQVSELILIQPKEILKCFEYFYPKVLGNDPIRLQ